MNPTQSEPGLPRRQFLRIAGASSFLFCSPKSFGLLHGQEEPQPAGTLEPSGSLPTVHLAFCDRSLPRLGFGASPISRIDEAKALAVINHAIEAGIRYFDTAPSYGNGVSEKRVGKAIAESGIPREQFFVATKTLRRDSGGARRELEQSLRHLQVEYVDSVQVHAVRRDYETVFAQDSVLRALESAKNEKLVRHIGVTGHENPKYLIECIKRFSFDTALVPVNPIDTQLLSFVQDFLPEAVERRVSVIGMKVYAGGSLLKNGGVKAGELLKYALSQPGVDVVVPGCDRIEYVDGAVEAVKGFEDPLAPAQLKSLEERVGPHKGASSEWYKERK